MDDPRIQEALASGLVPLGVTAEDLDENHDAAGIAGIVAVTALAVLVVILRTISRKFVVKRFGLGLDDWLTIVSLLIFIPFSALCIQMIRMGSARTPFYQDYVLEFETYLQIQIFDSVAHLVYSTALVLCRISGLAFYYRICSLQSEFLISIKIIFAFLVVAYLAQIFLIIFHCWPVTLIWGLAPEAGGDRCIQWFEIYTTVSIISLACDLLLFGFPAAMLKALDMQRKQKIQLACILLPGIAVIGISTARIVFVVGFGFQSYEAFDWSFLKLLCVEVSEISATIVALSIPGLKPLVDKYLLRKGVNGSSASSVRRGSIGSQDSGISAMKKEAQYGVGAK